MCYVQLYNTGRPNILTHPTGQQLSIVIGDEQVTLTCRAHGDDINGYWERVDDGPLPMQSNMSSVMEDSSVVTLLNLTITRARPMHSGRYHCIAYNEVGIDQSDDVTVTITSKRRAEIIIVITIKYAV